MLYLLPIVALVIAYAEYPEETKNMLYTIGHTTIRTGFYVRQKVCPKQTRRRKMSRPKASEAATLLSMAPTPSQKEE